MSTLSILSTSGEGIDNAAKRPIKLALISSGLGNTSRGFETSTARWYTALRKYTDMDVRLYSGGKHEDAKALWNIPRNNWLLRPAWHVPFAAEQNKWEFTYGVEQISFWSALNFSLIAWKPDVVWVKDVPLAHLLIASRIAFGLKFKIIFANGSKFKPSTYEHFDLTQQIQLRCYEEALSYGIPAAKMELLSNCFPDYAAQPCNREEVRRHLGCTPDDYMITCVAAWNRYHKRIDYLIREVAALNNPRVKLVLCGYPEVDTVSLKQLGASLLGDKVQWLTVPEPEVPSILQASDVFVLPSLVEGLGNALIEAALANIPVLTHPHEGAQFSIADEHWFADLSQPGNLTRKLAEFIENPPSKEMVARLRDSVSARFSPEQQSRQFYNMVSRTIPELTQVTKGNADNGSACTTTTTTTADPADRQDVIGSGKR